MPALKNIFKSTLHLFYPHLCVGCGSDLIDTGNIICLRCINNLPVTDFASFPDNPIERIFLGRIDLFAAHSEFYFTKFSLVQQLIHQLKYKGNKAIGIWLGEYLGTSLQKSNRFHQADLLVPMPLHVKKEKIRGYNQSAVICEGISRTLHIPVMYENVVRTKRTDTQTRKHRTERWNNVEGSFEVLRPWELDGKCVLLVDDVLTTGATLESCGQAILERADCKLGIVTLAHATK
jgi:ComF family protein